MRKSRASLLCIVPKKFISLMIEFLKAYVIIISEDSSTSLAIVAVKYMTVSECSDISSLIVGYVITTIRIGLDG